MGIIVRSGLLAIVLAFASATYSQDLPQQIPGNLVKTVVLRLQDESARFTTVTVRVGGFATMTRTGMPTLCLSPTMSADGLLTITSSLTPAGDCARSASATVSSQAPPSALGDSTRIELGGYVLNAEWVEAGAAGTAEPPTSGDASECCVVCEGMTACACRVRAPCGSCCDEACGGCDPIEGPSPCGTTTVARLQPVKARDRKLGKTVGVGARWGSTQSRTASKVPAER